MCNLPFGGVGCGDLVGLLWGIFIKCVGFGGEASSINVLNLDRQLMINTFH